MEFNHQTEKDSLFCSLSKDCFCLQNDLFSEHGMQVCVTWQQTDDSRAMN
jgi:hypothetical protein